jgi:HlyD family secretion protein
MRKRIGLAIALAVILLAGAGVAYYFLVPKPNVANQALVRRGTIQSSVNALGRLQPRRQLALSTRASGTVLRILVQEGQSAEAGALLLELDAREYNDAVAQAERNLQVRQDQLDEALRSPSSADIGLARAHLRQATAARLKAQQDYDKIANKPNAGSSNEALALETAKLEYEVAKGDFDRTLQGPPTTQVDRLRADVQDAELSLRQATEHIETTRLRAPFAGTVMRIDPHVGENVGGFSPLIQFAELSQLEIRAEVDELDVPKVAEGQSVQIRLDAFAGHPLQGRLVRLFPGVSDARGTTTYGAIVSFDTESLAVRPGMGANLTIVTQVAENVLLVPRRAIRQVGRYQVVRILAGGREKEAIVTTGLSNDNEVEILSGLEEGQRILLN